MTWLRISDGFTSNSKIAQLTDKDFRVWMRLLCYCGNARDPSVDSVTKREVSGLTTARVSRFFGLRLLDAMGDDFEVHDWTKYLPKDEQNALRQAKFRARHRNAQRNAESNAQDDAESNASNGPSRAGTRGVPSRPVVDQEPSLPPSVVKGANGTNGRKEGAQPQDIPAQIAASLRQAATFDEDDIPF